MISDQEKMYIEQIKKSPMTDEQKDYLLEQKFIPIIGDSLLKKHKFESIDYLCEKFFYSPLSREIFEQQDEYRCTFRAYGRYQDNGVPLTQVFIIEYTYIANFTAEKVWEYYSVFESTETNYLQCPLYDEHNPFNE